VEVLLNYNKRCYEINELYHAFDQVIKTLNLAKTSLLLGNDN
jgi:hypothetical protein